MIRARSPRRVEVLATFVVEGLINRARQSRPFVSGQRLRDGRTTVRRRRRRQLDVVECSHKQSRNAYLGIAPAEHCRFAGESGATTFLRELPAHGVVPVVGTMRDWRSFVTRGGAT